LSIVKLPEHQWKKAQQQIPDNLNALIETLKAAQKALRWVEILPLQEEQVIYSSRHGFMG